MLTCRLEIGRGARPESRLRAAGAGRVGGLYVSMMANRLANETSPYLLAHADNPVDWYPWGEEAFARAQREDRPIFLSIGYAACHWCHVMERESFENASIAEFLNRHFVSIKVDREERPDVDQIYLAVTAAISGAAGWPMTVFLTPDRRPLYAGTYFPPEDQPGRPGLLTLLQRMTELWEKERPAWLEQADELTAQIRDRSPSGPGSTPDERVMARAVAQLARLYDPVFGGFGEPPKFPPHQVLGLLWRYHRRSRDPKARAMAEETLEGMQRGGIRDHIGGGFARYSTDRSWLVPHFEKMLYDNAQLAIAYLEALEVTGQHEYGQVAGETLDYVARELQAPEGGYYSAVDADSQGDEGGFYVFSREELEQILGREDSAIFSSYYGVTAAGNWRGRNVLHTPRSLEEVAHELGMETDLLAARLELSRRRVYVARQARVPPRLDDQVLTGWNGLMLGAMAEGYRVLGHARYLTSAVRAARFALERLRVSDGRLLRTWRANQARIPGFLEDYAYLSDGLISLYEASGDDELLEAALDLAERMVREFGDRSGAFSSTSTAHGPLIARVREGHDGSLPSANGIAARSLARLSYHLDRWDLRERARSALMAYGQEVERHPSAFATTLGVLDFLREGPAELVLVGLPGTADREALASTLGGSYLPNRVVALVDPRRPSISALARGKHLVHGRAVLHVCQNSLCREPMITPSAVRAWLAADRAA